MDDHEKALAAALCARVAADLDELGPRITRSIRLAQPEYSLVPLDDHVEHVTEQQRLLLVALGRHEVVGVGQRTRAADLGRLRATQGVSVATVIGAYHVGNRELWQTLVAYAQDETPCLPGLATLLWRSIEVMTAEIVAAYETTARARQNHVLSLRQRLVELLERDELAAEAHDVAATLGLDPAGEFAAAWVGLDDDPLSLAARLAAGLRRGTVLAVGHASGIQVLAQGLTADELEAGIRSVEPGARLGIGLARPGLVGARESLVDARLCLEVTTEAHPTRRFHEDWMRATIRAQVGRLEPVVSELRDVVAANPHLVETLDVYVDSGFSIAEAARVLHLHPNSVAYRLERWNRLTGWDAKTFRGLSQSLLAAIL